jgi:hypothetical protein
VFRHFPQPNEGNPRDTKRIIGQGTGQYGCWNPMKDLHVCLCLKLSVKNTCAHPSIFRDLVALVLFPKQLQPPGQICLHALDARPDLGGNRIAATQKAHNTSLFRRLLQNPGILLPDSGTNKRRKSLSGLSITWQDKGISAN